MMAQRTVLITGAGRGIGLEWTHQDLAGGARVIATARDPGDSPELRALASRSPGLVILQMDVSDDASVERARRQVEERFSGIDDLINNAGTYGPRDQEPLGPAPDDLRRVLEVNTVGPYRVTRAFLPLLRKGTGARIAFITSRMGSLGDRPTGGAYAYRMSKSALNMLGANLAHDLREKKIACLLLHPGWVRTRMGGERGRFDPVESVAGMRRVFGKVTLDRSGTFVDLAGEIVPW